MKAFIAGTAAAVVIAVAAGVIMNTLGLSTADTFVTPNVRL